MSFQNFAPERISSWNSVEKTAKSEKTSSGPSDQRCKEYGDWKNLISSSASVFWKNVTNINAELNFLSEFAQIDYDQKFLRMLSHLSKVDQLTLRLKQLSTVIEIFKIPRNEGDWLEMTIGDLDAQDIILEKLSSVFDFLSDHLAAVNEDSWSLIKELSIAVDFIAFLREIADHDLKNLINGVDDERLIQEDTVSSLIQVKQFMVPLLNVATTFDLDAFLKELCKVASLSPMLANKIALCNSNNMALQNMYANISNRGEVAKEKIQNAVNIGTYKFEWSSKDLKCKVTLSYAINKTTTVSYDINDLQDLKGRALLITKPSDAMSISLGDTNIGGGSKKSKDLMEEFVRQVDIVQGIINVSERLIETGNFGYRKHMSSIKGTEKMVQLLEKLQADLKKWEILVDKAQQNHFYLTFFPARHMLEFYDHFIGKSSVNTNTCQTLIKFVNQNARLPRKPSYNKMTDRKDATIQILNEIGEKLQAIFAKVPKRRRPLKAPVDRIISDVVERGKLFVASCNDKSRLPNVIMSLYANHGSYPEAWQLLICTASTTLEELSIFIKRCFFASKNGYDNYLFCLANLELLDYELQYNLVNKIRSMREKENDYYLALICCPEAGMHHHVLDQFSDFRTTKGLSTASMKKIYKELCPQIFCVSSELSGQGKTEWIKQESFRNKTFPKCFLISDDADYVKLVKQLKEFVLRPFECMHINVISSDYPGEVNMWLFQLLTLRIVSSNTDIACLPNTHIYIEIASSFEQHLLRSLPIIECLQKTHLAWDITDLVVTQESNSPVQIVCRYLSALDSENIDKRDIYIKGPIPALSPKECQKLLSKYFFDDDNLEDVSSFRFLEIFVNVFAYQLVRLSFSSYFRVKNLKLMLEGETNIRETLVKTLLQVSKDFATRSVRTKSAQLEATSIDAIENAALGTIVNWDDSNHLLVFFLSQTPDSICALYRDQAKVPEVVRSLMKSQHIDETNKKWKLEDYQKLSMEILLQKLEGIARKTFHQIDYPPYALSNDNFDFNEKDFSNIIKEEQEDYINRMVCPPNTAQNEALLENVLVMIVCILTRIPVFIIGAPGSSKSLAIRLISQNLRGSDSNDEYFRKLPQACNVYLIPHQGSSSSTSDGILKVFQKAQNFQETSSKEFPVISVVLLDEVGLAETSPFNPLKVLHSLLEPSYPSDGPKVSVIGISNWRLDNSKSSRALLVQRPKFDTEDLVDTAVRLIGNKTHDKIQKNSLLPLAIAYSEYEQKGQKHSNFHGLRDYYALVKSLSMNELIPEHIHMALARNFGGTEQFAEICQTYFGNVINTFNNNQAWVYRPISINKLVHANLDDEGARHLMVIGKSDSIVNLLTYELRQKNLNPVIILGSQFPDDQDDYSYNVLSRIMDPKYYTRVALGAYANPMLYVNKNFRCILVLDEKNLPKADPPLLNRFEKQKMTIHDTLSDNEKELVQQLSSWTKLISTVETLNQNTVSHDKFTQKDLFIGFEQGETLESLVIDTRKKNPDARDSEILTKCKESLINIASSDGIVRAEKSELSLDEVRHWTNVYFKVQHHDHLADYFEDLLTNENLELYPDGHQVIINTFSNINTDVKLCLKGLIECQVIKLSTFKTEAQFQNQVKNFWFESPNRMLILQCDITTMNAGCIKLAKFIIEQTRNEYLMKNKSETTGDFTTKHACIILHVHRDHKTTLSAFNFMCGWRQVTIETLIPQEKRLSALLDGDLSDVINTTYPFEEILQHELIWCLLCMKYPSNARSINHIKTLNVKIPQNKSFVDFLRMKTRELLQGNYSSRGWQYYVASNKKLLYPYSSFSAALQAYIRSIVRQPIAKILCALERLSATKTFLSFDQASPQQQLQLREFWREMFNDKTITRIDELSDAKPDGYSMPTAVYDLRFPFSYYFMNQIDGFKKVYEEELDLLMEDPNNIDPGTGNLYESTIANHIKNLSNNIASSLKNIKASPLEYFPELYFEDFVSRICTDDSSVKYVPLMSYILRWRLGSEKIYNPIILHTHWWKHSASIMTEFRLAQMCPPIVKETSLKNGNLLNISFEDYLVEEIIKMMNKKLSEIRSTNKAHIPQLRNWLREVSVISALCDRLTEVSNFSALHLLQMCNDFVSADAITLSSIGEIMKTANIAIKKPDAFSPKFINSVFEMLDKLQNDDANLIPKLSFINKCFNIVSLDSPARLELYRNIFSKDPLPTISTSIIGMIFGQEETINPGSFVAMIKNPKKALSQSSRLRVITDSLSNQSLDSPMPTLCCDILQKSFFSKLSLQELADIYQYSAEALNDAKEVMLQKICAIACLKEFAQKFWDHSIQEAVLQPIQFDELRIGDLDTTELITKVNDSMNLTFPLIHSFKIYFLRVLRHRGMSMSEVRRFCDAQQQNLPWLQELPWNKIKEIQLPFNPYWALEQYIEIEKSFTTLYGMDNKGSFNSIFASLKKKEASQVSFSSIALMGLIFSRLHVVRASREWDTAEKRSAEFLRQKIDQSALSDIYKQIITKLVKNEHELLHLSPTTTNSELLLKSVICHVIALHASSSAGTSPLAYMFHNLDKCSKMFIPTCSSDVESVIINAVIQSGQVTRYSCSCGFKYVIANCGMANGRGKCPECKATIGGENHVISRGQIKLDANPINRALAARDQPGYISETNNNGLNNCLRSLNPASYRILHLFIHAIIGACGTSPVTTNFLKHDNETDVSEYCMAHIKSDWFVLQRIFNISDEDLALLLHSILCMMTEVPPMSSTLNSSAEREEWEKNFSSSYVEPSTKNSTETAKNFLMEITKAAADSQESVDIVEGEVNQILKMDKQYNVRHLPKLWRMIDDVGFDSFRAFYSGDLTNNVENYPLLSVFFKYEQQLPHVRHLIPIIKFLRILKSKLEYKLNRSEAQELTFQGFIESVDEESTEASNNLKLAFDDFAHAWNSVIDLVQNYQCHELPSKPRISIESPVAFGLIEPKDAGVYICAILEHLIGIQNNFLQEVSAINPGKFASLVFLKDMSFYGNDTGSASSSKTIQTSQYCIHAMRVEQIQPNNIISFQWDDDILQYSQRNLEAGRGLDVKFNLQKIESDLAHFLVFEKVHIDTVNDSQLYMEPFAYHMELFQGSIRILGEIKEMIPQQKISAEKIDLILGSAISLTVNSSGYQYLTFDNASELLSSLEILLCFVKKTSIGDGEISINEYVSQWMKLSSLLDNESFSNLLNAGLKLKHLVALYELAEEQVANGVIKYINDKYKEPLTSELEQEITLALDFQFVRQEENEDPLSQNNSNEQKRIPAEYFVSALKRFMLRFLNDYSGKETEPLSIYFTDMTLNLWSPDVQEETVDNFFPTSLLVAHIYEAYTFVNDKLELIIKQTPIVTKPKAIAAPKVTKIVTAGKKLPSNKGKSVTSPTTKKPLIKSTLSTGAKNRTVGESSKSASSPTAVRSPMSPSSPTLRRKFNEK
ncbi:3616_t:CDS:10 [Acaulospora morrowiae]|uniref:3616_t:CDS:1 n=1 Tax=Acaulospora morrowiae TaxID=94023 RepID=A0A9N8VM43_9GLOM|nr:3616_t:CDS:10 [Acaulospora morrowiae]